MLFINIFNLQFFFLQATTLRREPSPMKLLWRQICEVKTVERGCNSSLTIALNILCYVRSTIFFCKLLFSWIEFDNFSFYFQETYNSQLRKRHGNDPSTHPDFDLDLWMDARSYGGPDRNRVYRLSNITGENLRTACSVSIIRSLQSISSTQFQEFAALQEHTTHLTEKYEWLSADYEELRHMVMDMRS